METAERGPTQVSCTCGSKFTDVTENEAYARFQGHVREQAEQDDLLHFRDDVQVVLGGPDAALTPAERMFAMSGDIARRLHRRNFGQDWTTKEEAELLKDMLFFTVEQNHQAYHLDELDSPEDWSRCRRITCTYVAVGLGERKEEAKDGSSRQ